nr:MAG TPA: hypothetical protein [Microviridae sp.]
MSFNVVFCPLLCVFWFYCYFQHCCHALVIFKFSEFVCVCHLWHLPFSDYILSFFSDFVKVFLEEFFIKWPLLRATRRNFQRSAALTFPFDSGLLLLSFQHFQHSFQLFNIVKL